MSMIYPTKNEVNKIYKDTEKAEKDRQQIKKIGERLNAK